MTSLSTVSPDPLLRRALTQLKTTPLVLRLTALLAILTLMCGTYLALVPLHTTMSLSLGATPSHVLSGFYDAETVAETGEGFRWSNGAGTLQLYPAGEGAHIVQLRMSAPLALTQPVPVTLAVNRVTVANVNQDSSLRRVYVLIPADLVRRSVNELQVTSPTFTPAEGLQPARQLGVALFAAGWQGVDAMPWLVPLQALVVASAAVLLLLLLLRAGIPGLPALAVSLLFVAILIATRHSDTRFLMRWHALMLTAGLGLACAIVAPLMRPSTAEGPLPIRAWLQAHWLAFVGYLAITLLMLAPMLPRFNTHISSVPGDSYEYLWNLQWWSEALLHEHVSPTFVPQLMAPAGFELALSEMSPAHTFLGLPLTALFGPIVSYNSLVLASYVLSGFFTYLLVQRFGTRRDAAFVAGLIFAFTVRRFFQHNAGHLNLMGTQWIPLALYGWEGVLTRRRSWDGFVAGLGLALTSWSTWYYGPTFALFMALYALLRPGFRQMPAALASWRAVFITAALTVALVAPVAQPYLEVRQGGVALNHGVIHLQVHSPRPNEYLLPNPFHPLWGEWARQLYRNDGGEHFVAVSYTALLLGIVGAVLAWRRQRSLVVALLTLVLINAVMALGPFLYPPGGGQIALPALFVYEQVPILDGIRVWNRLIFYVVLCIAILSGLALSALPRRLRLPMGTLAGILILAECASQLASSSPQPRPLDSWLAQQPGQGAVIQMPAGPSGLQSYYSLFHRRPINMWHGTFEPPLYAEGVGLLNRFPAEASLRLLQRWKTEFIIVDEGAMYGREPDWETTLAAQPLVELVYRQDGFSIYRLLR